MGRKLEWPEKVLASLAAGTLARIEAARAEGEDTRAFIRQAIERELKRRLKPPPSR
jgi:hypothetical protein